MTQPSPQQLVSLMIRSNGQTVQTCPGVAVLWGDVPGPSSFASSWPRSWRQFWQQSARMAVMSARADLPSQTWPSSRRPTGTARKSTRAGCPAGTDGLDRFRESPIILRRVRGRPPHFHPHADGRQPGLILFARQPDQMSASLSVLGGPGSLGCEPTIGGSSNLTGHDTGSA
jgi:hypothetical protein